jgi:hypothetical protein
MSRASMPTILLPLTELSFELATAHAVVTFVLRLDIHL